MLICIVKSKGHSVIILIILSFDPVSSACYILAFSLCDLLHCRIVECFSTIAMIHTRIAIRIDHCLLRFFNGAVYFRFVPSVFSWLVHPVVVHWFWGHVGMWIVIECVPAMHAMVKFLLNLIMRSIMPLTQIHILFEFHKLFHFGFAFDGAYELS